MIRRTIGLLLAALCCHFASAQQLAITFDDLPAHDDLPPGITRAQVATEVVRALNAHHVPQVYGFINGGADEDADTHAVFEIWRKGGHLLGNHTFSHPDINDVTAGEFTGDIAKNDPLLLRFMPDADFHWFRYPFLHEGDTEDKHEEVRDWLTDNGYRVAEVTMDFGDYLWNAPYARCSAKHDEAAIRRLHDTYLANADKFQRYFRQLSQLTYHRDVKYILLMHIGAFDARMLPELLNLYQRRGYRFITLPEAEADPIYRADPDDMEDPSGGTLIEQTLAKRKQDFPDATKPEKMLDKLCR